MVAWRWLPGGGYLEVVVGLELGFLKAAFQNPAFLLRRVCEVVQTRCGGPGLFFSDEASRTRQSTQTPGKVKHFIEYGQRTGSSSLFVYFNHKDARGEMIIKVEYFLSTGIETGRKSKAAGVLEVKCNFNPQVNYHFRYFLCLNCMISRE